MLYLRVLCLSYFELISGIAPLAWIEHTTAAEKLMVILGPEALRHEVIGQLFYSIRSHSVQRAAIYGQYSAFSEQEWQEQNLTELLPRQRRSAARNHYDLLIEYILRLSRYVHGYDSSSADIDADAMLKELENLYAEFLTARGMTAEDAPAIENILPLPLWCTLLVMPLMHSIHHSTSSFLPCLSATSTQRLSCFSVIYPRSRDWVMILLTMRIR